MIYVEKALVTSDKDLEGSSSCRLHISAACANTPRPPVNEGMMWTGRTCRPPLLQSCHRHTGRKKGNRESNSHRFFNLTPYRFPSSPPRWCPAAPAATHLTDGEGPSWSSRGPGGSRHQKPGCRYHEVFKTSTSIPI